MEKMENLEQLGNLQKEIAAATQLQRFLEQNDLTSDQLSEKIHSWFFENLKREFANRLSVLEAYFVSDCNFHDFESCREVLCFLNDLSCEVGEYIISLRLDEEESEVNNA